MSGRWARTHSSRSSGGELREAAAAGGRRGKIGGQFCGYLSVYGERGRKGCVLTSGTGLVVDQTPTTLLVPDLMYFRVDHLPAGGIPIWFMETPPDVILEVCSPSHRFSALVEKTAIYLRFGVPLVWIANSDEKTVSAFSQHHVRVYHSGDMLDGGDVLPGFSVAVDDLFL